MTKERPHRRLSGSEISIFGLMWAFLMAYGAMILVTREVSGSTKRSGIVHLSGDDADFMGIVVWMLAGLVFPILASRWIESSRTFKLVMAASVLAHGLAAALMSGKAGLG